MTFTFTYEVFYFSVKSVLLLQRIKEFVEKICDVLLGSLV
jgi:hypothetical protein